MHENKKKDGKQFKDIKSSILSSGIPLEYSICKKLERFKIHNLGEFLYERNDKTFSVDIYGFDFINFQIQKYTFISKMNFLVECKYREDNKNWYFINFGDYTFRGSESQNIFIDFPIREFIWQSSTDSMKGYNDYIRNTGSYRYDNFVNSPIAHKGIEIILNGGPNLNSITNSIYQLSFGVSNLISKELKLFIEDTIPRHIFSYIITIIVTTAKLYVMKNEVTIEKIRNAQKNNELFNNEIFNQVDSVMYHWNLPNDLTEYSLRILNYGDKMWKTWDFVNKIGNERIIDDISKHHPSRFLIINYEKFDDIFKSLLSQIKTKTRFLVNHYQIDKNKLRRKDSDSQYLGSIHPEDVDFA